MIQGGYLRAKVRFLADDPKICHFWVMDMYFWTIFKAVMNSWCLSQSYILIKKGPNGKLGQ